MNIGRLADFLAGEPEPGYSPSLRGIAESDSSDGEVEVYLGEVEQVYQTSMQPLYEVDEDGDIVYDDEGLPVQMVDGDGQPMSAMQTVYDEDGNPVPELDSDGFPVFEKVQLLDADGDPIVEYDADGNPVAQTDPDTGLPVYLEDADGNRIPELDEAGEIVYQRDPETGETILDEDDNPVPVYQVAPVEESQVAVIEAIGTVRTGETPVISMGGAASTAIAAGGWGDSIEQTFVELGDSVTVAQTVADEANAVATATNQHFWTDEDGTHVTPMTQEAWQQAVADDFPGIYDGTNDYPNSLWNSLGMLFRRAMFNLVSITKSAVAFFDGEGNGADNITARFGTDGAQVGANNVPHITMDSDGIAFYDGEGTLSRHTSTLVTPSGIRAGKQAGFHMTAANGFEVANGPDAFISLKNMTLVGGNVCPSDVIATPLPDCTILEDYGSYDTADDGSYYSLAKAVQDAHDEADAQGVPYSDSLHIVPTDPDWVYVDVPVGEPEPDLWIGPTNGDIAGAWMTIERVEETGSIAGGLYNVDGDEQDGNSVYGHRYGDQFNMTIPSGYTRSYFMFRSGYQFRFRVCSSYDKYTADVAVDTNLEVSGDATITGDLTAGGEVEDGYGNRLSDKLDKGDVVTGVKGAAEDSYRRGDVEIDEGDLGLGRLGETDIDAIIALAG